MANKIQIRRGLKSKLPSSASAGEPLFSTDSRELFMGTGSGVVNMTGSHWYNGTAMSGTSSTSNAYYYSACPEVKLGDVYLNTTYGYIYECTTAGRGTTARWTYRGSIKGATGTRANIISVGTAMSGTSTTTGAYNYSGASNALVGDIYINTGNGNLYRCTTAGSGLNAKWTYQGCINVIPTEFLTLLARMTKSEIITENDSVNDWKYLPTENNPDTTLYCYKSRGLPAGSVCGQFSSNYGDIYTENGSTYLPQSYTDFMTGQTYVRDIDGDIHDGTFEIFMPLADTPWRQLD